MLRWRANARRGGATLRRVSSHYGRRISVASVSLSPVQEEIVEKPDHGHTFVLGAYATGKSTAAAERLLWLNGHDRDRRVLLLSGRSTVDAAAAKYVDAVVPFYSLERRGHRIEGMIEWTQQTLEELGYSGKRMLSFPRMTAFLMHHVQELPLQAFHHRLASASTVQLRRTVADLLRFLTMLEAHGVNAEAYKAFAASSGDEKQVELAHAYAVYRDLQRRHDVITWDGMVLELMELLAADPHYLATVTQEFTDVVVDDVEQLSPAMVRVLSLVLQQPHIVSGTCFSEVLSQVAACPRLAQLERSLPRVPEILRMPVDGDRAVPASTDRNMVSHTAAKVLGLRSPTISAASSSQIPTTSLHFSSFADECDGVATLVHQKIQASTHHPRITVLCPTRADVPAITQALLDRGVAVHGPHVTVDRRDLFDDPCVAALSSLLAALWTPSEPKHLYNVLRSTFFSFPPSALSSLMEIQHQNASRMTLLEVLTHCVDTSGRDLRRCGLDDGSVDTAVAIARAFIEIVDECKTQCHDKSVQDIVQLFLDRTGHLNRLMDPQTTQDAQQAIAMAAFLREIEAAQRVVGSVHVPFVVPYLTQLQSARIGMVDDAGGDDDHSVDGVRVLQLAQYDLDQLCVDASTDDVVVLMAMRDSKFPGRLRRITWPLPFELLTPPLPVQTRSEFVEVAETLVHDVLVQRNPRELVISYSRTSGAKKEETISRVLLPLWTEPTSSTPTSLPSTPSSTLSSTPSSTPASEPPAPSQNTRAAKLTVSFKPPHLSYSQITEYTRCPHKYYLSRVVGLRSADASPSLAMMFGSAIHEAIAAYASAIQSTTANHKDAEARAWSTLGECWRSDGFLSTRQERFFRERADTTLREFIVHSEDSSDAIVYVEEEFECRLGHSGDVLVRGVWDRVDHTPNGIVIREFKTNPSAQRRSKLDAVAADSLQLKMYMVAYEKIHGVTPYGATLEVLGAADGDSSGKRQVGFVLFTPDIRGQVADAVDETMAAIRSGAFPPTPNFMECSMCPYTASACHVRGRVNVDDEDAMATVRG